MLAGPPLTQACDWTLDRRLFGNRLDAKNVADTLRYRKTSKFVTDIPPSLGSHSPVKLGVRPAKPDGRDGRLREREENRLLDVAEKSSRPWLEAAVIISIEIRVRQSEFAGLTWG